MEIKKTVRQWRKIYPSRSWQATRVESNIARRNGGSQDSKDAVLRLLIELLFGADRRLF